ncbi:MAG: fumarylacetoacetate hydrolase family protein [Chloroflexi bacterium]|nr:fumarylacetoacetate hydrolase family protein [Chloroflexota bacterium]
MKIARFLWEGRPHWGVVEGDDLRDFPDGPFTGHQPGNVLCRLSDAKLLAPIDPYANKVPAMAANYGEKAGRDGPGIFMKQPGTVIGPHEAIIYPRSCIRVVHEAEVGIVIGRQARHIGVEDALDFVLGYTCVNDVSAMAMKTNDVGRGMSLRWKHFDTFCPMGPYIVTDLDGDSLGIACRVNGETVLEGSTSDMLWGVAEVVSWVSEVMTLYPGDIIPSGCPGALPFEVGDTVEVEVEGIGTLSNPVVADS